MYVLSWESAEARERVIGGINGMRSAHNGRTAAPGVGHMIRSKLLLLLGLAHKLEYIRLLRMTCKSVREFGVQSLWRR
jgi:hypothetical protein